MQPGVQRTRLIIIMNESWRYISTYSVFAHVANTACGVVHRAVWLLHRTEPNRCKFARLIYWNSLIFFARRRLYGFDRRSRIEDQRKIYRLKFQPIWVLVVFCCCCGCVIYDMNVKRYEIVELFNAQVMIVNRLYLTMDTFLERRKKSILFAIRSSEDERRSSIELLISTDDLWYISDFRYTWTVQTNFPESD